MKNYLTEFIGTFFLVLTVGLTVTAGLPMAPLAIGCSLMIMVYMGGHISGGHYNPAVSLGLMLRGKLSRGLLIPYWISQILGSLVAAYVVRYVTGHTFAPAPGLRVTAPQALLIEILFTFALAIVVMNSAAHNATKGNSFYGLAIGFTIVVAAFAGGPISGGAFNPAVAIGSTIVNATQGGGTWSNLWLYLVGPFAGAIVAAGVFAIQEK